ncbi:hypothetical protein JQN58_29005 [Aneurinibacillus sp. BA2021]|nr:hypothetical protein [Aneurinibacillus sp. BA2021]
MVTRKRAVAAYAITATLIRGADAGLVVGIVLLATSSPETAPVAGLLAACLTAPHLAGPLVAPVLGRAKRPIALLAAAFVLYALFVAVAALAFTAGWLVLAAVALAAAGGCGPLFTGGLSSQLPRLVNREQTTQRRAQGLDALTYGVGAAFGPLIIAVATAVLTPLAGVLGAAAAALVGAAVLMTLPPLGSAAGGAGRRDAGASVRRNVALLFTSGPLRRVTVCTSVAAVAVGAVPILAVATVSVHEWGGRDAAALLAAAFGAGTLAGSLAVTVRPLRGAPEHAVTWAASGVSAALAVCALAPSRGVAAIGFALVGICGSLQFASSLAARSEYSPPEARAQVFMTMAGLKVACSSVGVAVAGTAVTNAPLVVLGGAVATVAVAFGAAVIDRRASRRRENVIAVSS